MAAYNYVEFEATCPSCHQLATIECQTHIASSFNGDKTGRFCHRTYRLGDKMLWYPLGHLRFNKWREDSEPDQPPNQAVEACYCECQNCKAELCAVIRFEEVTPVEVTFLDLETRWPEGYYK